MRSRRSSALMGNAWAFIDCKASIGPGSAVAGPGLPAAPCAGLREVISEAPEASVATRRNWRRLNIRTPLGKEIQAVQIKIIGFTSAISWPAVYVEELYQLVAVVAAVILARVINHWGSRGLPALRKLAYYFKRRSPALGQTLLWQRNSHRMDDTAEGKNLLAATLIESIKIGNDAKVKELLQADPLLARARDRDGVSALLWSIYSKQKEITRMLIDQAAPMDIFEACACGQLARVESLIESGKTDGYSADGWTPLHLAAAFGHVDVVNALLSHGAEIEQRSTNYMNNTALAACTAISRSHEIAEELLRRGADVNTRQTGGFTPLHEAASQGSVDLCQLLLDHGADISARTNEGKTPLEMARDKEQGDVVALLEARHRQSENQNPGN